jgi:hypothetical protein
MPYIIKIANPGKYAKPLYESGLLHSLEGEGWFNKRCWASGNYDSSPNTKGVWVEFEVTAKMLPGLVKKISKTIDGTFCAGVRYLEPVKRQKHPILAP